MGDDRAIERREIFKDCIRSAGIESTVIATGSFRAGTTLVTSLLSDNGVPSIDKEKFADAYSFAQPGTEKAFKAALNKIFSTAQDGLFATKLMWPHRNELSKALCFSRSEASEFASCFPDSKWLNISRQDKISQAISFFRAGKSNRWHIYKDEKEPEVAYSFTDIRNAISELSIHDRLWDMFYDHAGVSPFSIVYEEFIQDIPANLAALVDHLGTSHRRATSDLMSQPTLKKQRDHLSREMYARFLDDCFSSGF